MSLRSVRRGNKTSKSVVSLLGSSINIDQARAGNLYTNMNYFGRMNKNVGKEKKEYRGGDINLYLKDNMPDLSINASELIESDTDRF